MSKLVRNDLKISKKHYKKTSETYQNTYQKFFKNSRNYVEIYIYIKLKAKYHKMTPNK